jgi:hypothetical protein
VVELRPLNSTFAVHAIIDPSAPSFTKLANSDRIEASLVGNFGHQGSSREGKQ